MSDLLNDDWLRSLAWDLWLPDWSARVDRLADLGWSDAELRHAVTMPFWLAAPEQLRAEVAAHLA